MTLRTICKLFASLVLCLGVGGISGAITGSQIATWYATIAKPPWTPPNWVFGPVWTALYTLMAISLWLLWDRSAPDPARRMAIVLFVLQLVLNAAWSPVFFTLHRPLPALLVILALLLLIGATAWTAAKVNRLAARLLVPYLLWVAFASALNGAIVAMNP